MHTANNCLRLPKALCHMVSCPTSSYTTQDAVTEHTDPECSIESIQAILLMSRFIGNSEHGASLCPGFWGLLGYAVRSAQQVCRLHAAVQRTDAR